MKTNGLPRNYIARPVSLPDLPEVVQTLNASSRHALGVDKYTQSMFQTEWTFPGFNPQTDTLIVVAPSGEVAGYYEVWDLNLPPVRVGCWGRVHPAHTGRGIGSYLLAWAEGRASQAIPKTPPEARVVLQCGVPTICSKAHALFSQAGFQRIRRSLRMVIDLNAPPPEPHWPEGITVRTMLRGQDERQVLQAVRDSFRDHWGFVETPFEDEFSRFMHSMAEDPDFDPTLWFLACAGEEIAGISLCRPKVSDDPEMGWVGTLGVRRPWRRRGVALALLYHSFGEFYRRGSHRAGLGVDAQSLTGATHLYERAGMHSDPNHQFEMYEKELRPGVNLFTETVPEAVQE